VSAPDTVAPPALDAESALAHAPPGHKDELRLWLRMLTCTTLVEVGVFRPKDSCFSKKHLHAWNPVS
jgi:hypothetical protein